MRVLCLVLLASVVVTGTAAADAILLEDGFNTFSLGTAWQATSWDGGTAGENATGAPDVSLLGGVSHGGAVTLQMGSDGAPPEWKGIETIAAITAPGGASALTLNVRTTAANAHLPIEVGLLGESGEWVKMYYTYNAWTTNYSDSDGNTASWGSWYSRTAPGSFRRWEMTIGVAGVVANIYDDLDVLRNTWTFAGPTLADFGSTVDVVLRQQRAGLDPGSFPPTVYVDSVRVSSVPEPATLSLLAFGGLGILARRRRTRR